jgi:hypothetical protein
MLALRIPNLEMHIYANGRHPGDPLRDGSHMTGGLTDRNGIPFGSWQFRFIEWFRDLGFLQPPGIETKAARDLVLSESASPRAQRTRYRRLTHPIRSPRDTALSLKCPMLDIEPLFRTACARSGL